MAGMIWFMLLQLCGVLIIEYCMPQYRKIVRVWLGSVTGTVLAMWTPVPFAFLIGFTRTAHLFGTVLAGLLVVSARYFSKKQTRPAKPEFTLHSDKPLAVILPLLLILYSFLLITHTLSPQPDGLYSGQSTYGDMAMHLGFITSMAVQQTFPPYYSILPSAKICYPFLCDSISASMYLHGTALRWAYIVPMLFSFAQVVCGVWFTASEICRRRHAPILACVLFFLNGGFGALYFTGEYSLYDLMHGFYKTPTNLVEKGVRWVNVIADMLVPQRATLFGWAVLFACIWLLYRAVFKEDIRAWLPAGILGGLLPMIHTHSYFALGLVAACWLIHSASEEKLDRFWLIKWCLFGVPAVVMALPQLFTWTLSSVGGNGAFLRVSVDWVNHLEENWFVFWLKNIGPLFVLTPLSFLLVRREQRPIYAPAGLIFMLCELIVFQPNDYDNNKLLYVAYAFACLLSADGILCLCARIKKPSMRGLTLAVVVLLSVNAAVLTLARESVSGLPGYAYRLFTRDELAAADVISDRTAPDALFLTSDNHNNTVAVLTGRNILCGSGAYLYYHGLDYSRIREIEQAMLTDTAVFEAEKDILGIDYVYMGRSEKSLPGNIEAYLSESYPSIFTSDEVTVYKVN